MAEALNVVVVDEVSLLKAARELLWNGEGSPLRHPDDNGTTEYICHCLAHTSYHLVGYFSEAYYNVRKAVNFYCGNYLSYASTLIDLGVVDPGDYDNFAINVQKHRLMLIDQLIAYFTLENALANVQE